MSVIIKNTTGSSIFIEGTGTNVPANSQITVDPKYYLAYSGSATVGIDAEDSTFISNINSGNLVINDGNKDLSSVDGIRYLKNLTKLTIQDDGIDVEDAVSKINIIAVSPTTPNPGEVEIDLTPLTKRTFYAQYQRLDSLNFSAYLYSYRDIIDGSQPESGNSSNGYEFSGSAPIIIPFNGSIIKSIWAIKGASVSGGTVGPTVTANMEIFSVGFNGEGTKIDDLTIDIDSSVYTIGTFFNSFVDTDFKGTASHSIPVSEGDLIGIKFNDTSGPNDVEEIRNVTICLEIKEN